MDFRRLALRLYASLKSLRKVGALLQTAHSTVHRWHRTATEADSVRPIPRRRRSATENPILLDTVNAYLIRCPISTVQDVRCHVAAHLGIHLSNELIRLAVHKAGMTKKKARWYGRASTAAVEKTEAFLRLRSRLARRRRTWISIDETGFSANVRPLEGYAPKGQRLLMRDAVPPICKRHVSAIACVDRRSGTCVHSAYDGFINADRFVTFLETLTFGRGTVVLLDNVRFHHTAAVKALFARRGWTALYVPPYSPWFNPIEHVFAQVKHAFRRGSGVDAAFAAVDRSAAKAAFEHCLRVNGDGAQLQAPSS